MRLNKHYKFLQKLLLCLFIITLISCSTNKKYNRKRGKLSDAMEKAKDDYEGERVVETNYEIEDEDESADWLTFLFGCENTEKEENKTTIENQHIETEKKEIKFTSVWLQLHSDIGVMKVKNETDVFQMGVSLGGYVNEYNSLHFTFNAGVGNLMQDSEINESIRNEVDLMDLSLSVRKYATPLHTFIGGYLILGGGLSMILYDYRNPLTAIDEFGEIEYIDDDGLVGLNFFLGSGGHLFNSGRLRIGSELILGTKFWSPQTFADFTNDVIQVSPYIKLRFKFSLNPKHNNKKD